MTTLYSVQSVLRKRSFEKLFDQAISMRLSFENTTRELERCLVIKHKDRPITIDEWLASEHDQHLDTERRVKLRETLDRLALTRKKLTESAKVILPGGIKFMYKDFRIGLTNGKLVVERLL